MTPSYGQPLTEPDFERLVGIDRPIAENASIRRVDNLTARQLTGQNGPHDLTGTAFPYFMPGTAQVLEWSVRVDNPPMAELGKNGEFKGARKYLWPIGRPNRFYIHPGIKPEWLRDPSIPAIFVEGVKKALALWGLAFHRLSETAEKPRFIVIAVSGVWNWRTKTGREETEDGGWSPTTGPLPDFGWFTWENRIANILYDANVHTNPDVRAARKALDKHLRSLKVAEVRYVDLPQIEGINGVDDLLGIWPKDRMLALIEDDAYESSSFALTDLGNAERFVHQHSENVRFCHELGKSGEWLTWTGQRWQLDRQKRAIELAKETVRSMKAEADRLFQQAKPDLDRLQLQIESIPATDKKKCAEIQKQIEAVSHRAKKVLVWQQKSEQKRNIFDMLTLAQSVPDICVALGDLDQNHLLFNTVSGTIDLATGKLRKARREDLITQMSPVPFDATATCPRWEKFLTEVFEGHEDLIPFIKTYVGYSLTGLTREEYLAVLHGEGRNGKGVFIKTLAEMFGDYGTTADFNTFVDKGENTRAPRDDVANMKGKRFVASQETREGAKLAEALVKWLTGGDKLRARKLYENSDEFEPTWKIWLATNHKPEISGDDIGIWSRIKLIPFSVSFEGREDKSLKQDLLNELPGILRWAVEGCNTYFREGLVFPQSVLDATSEYKAESDKLAQWIQDCCVLDGSLQKYSHELHASYEKWCSRTHEKTILTRNTFGRRMNRRKDLKSKHGEKGTLYLGIGLKTEGSGYD